MTRSQFLDQYAADEQNYSPILRKFTTKERRSMVEDDLFAAESVSAVLSSIVVMGTLMVLGTVLYIVLAGYGM